jgi:predicted transposase YbfD/YdcC
VPSERTFRRVFADLDADGLDLETCGYAADVVRGTAPLPVVPRTPGPPERQERRALQRAVGHPAPAGLLPGKALRGTLTSTGRVFLVGAIAHVSGVVLGQRQVPDKRGEGAVAHDLLAPLDVAGMVLTLDALHTTRKTARLITDQLHAHYVLILKGNQPLARKAARALLKGTDTKFEETTAAAEDDQGHARTERRTLRTAPADSTVFPGATRSSACAATSAASTASGPARKSSSASPACPPTSPPPNTSTGTRGNTGQWRTGCTGYAM